METSSWGGSLYPSSRSYFPSLYVSVCIYHITHLSFSLPVFPTLSHKAVSKPTQESGESHELSLVAPSLLSGSPIIATFKDRTLTQRALYRLPFSIHFYPKWLWGPWELAGSLACLFYSVFLREVEWEWVFRDSKQEKRNACYNGFLFLCTSVYDRRHK